jgi:hypothetical protein
MEMGTSRRVWWFGTAPLANEANTAELMEPKCRLRVHTLVPLFSSTRGLTELVGARTAGATAQYPRSVAVHGLILAERYAVNMSDPNWDCSKGL